ncbi:LytTR family DNA-binding domain-containing protein [Rhodocytophaga aerolata]|uniref:LytTR family DNA-binding domain-containing protein n=1 Tax=Rhodocytophaga aerolata TaxID=455078 RepID=A0ABT8RCA6_9BACT|nr:LytTR family DNA-binding domain-containing protein [Rhodocytophaga aerolata]MDO1449733.1 LytTR family DNA-binding domain-containing protein [Rhodocytophaga aerolata]
MKLNCVIVDDEPLASEGLVKYVEVVDYLALAATAQNPVELNNILEHKVVDLILLDIQMPYMTGIEFLKMKTGLPMVILTTAYPDYAIESFGLDVIDYLLKPITFNRFFKATNKAKEYYGLKNQPAGRQSAPTEPGYLFIKCENKYEKIWIEDILFVQALQNYVIIVTGKGKYMTLLPLKTVEEQLSANLFVRVHKSYLVSISKIESIENSEIIIQNHQVPLSRNFKELVIERVVHAKLLRK